MPFALCGLFLFFISASSVNSSSTLDSILAVKVVDHIACEQYDEALHLADSLRLDGEQLLPGWFLRASVLSSRLTDFEDELDDEALLHACKQVQELCEIAIREGDRSAMTRFYLASVLGYLSFRAFKHDNLMETISLAKKMGHLYEEAVSLDSTCWDAYLGLGAYYYHSSARAGLLRRVGLISDKRDEGIRLVKISAERGTFSRLAARSNLAWLAIDRERYDEAVQIITQLLEGYPNRRAFLWAMGRVRMKQRNWNEAIKIYETLLVSLRSEARNNHYNEIGCLHALAVAHGKLGDWRRVRKLTDEALAIDLSSGVAERKKKDLDRLKKLRRQALSKTIDSD